VQNWYKSKDVNECNSGPSEIAPVQLHLAVLPLPPTPILGSRVVQKEPKRIEVLLILEHQNIKTNGWVWHPPDGLISGGLLQEGSKCGSGTIRP